MRTSKGIFAGLPYRTRTDVAFMRPAPWMSRHTPRRHRDGEIAVLPGLPNQVVRSDLDDYLRRDELEEYVDRMSSLYGVCSDEGTSRSVQVDGVTKLFKGLTIHVLFEHRSGGSCDLDVNALGSKQVRFLIKLLAPTVIHGSERWSHTFMKGGWEDNQVVSLTYDGSVWRLNEHDVNDMSTNVYDISSNSLSARRRIYFVGTDGPSSFDSPDREDRGLTWSDRRIYDQSGSLYTSDGKLISASSQDNLTNKTYEGYQLGDACAKGVDDEILSATSENLPTTAAVLGYLAGQGMVDTNTTYSLSKSGSTITLAGSDGSTSTVTDDDTQALTGVKGDAESSYRTGNVSISAADIGVESDATHDYQVTVTDGTDTIDSKSGDVTIEAGPNIEISLQNDHATIGIKDIGDVITSSPSAVSVPNTTNQTIGSITLPAGVWVVTVSTTFESNSSGRRTVYFSSNASIASVSVQNPASLTMAPANGGMSKYDSVDIMRPTGQTTYYCRVWQNSGQALNCQCHLKAVRIA